VILEQFYLNCLAHASYLVGDRETRTAVIVDPHRNVDEYIAFLKERGLTLAGIFDTHLQAGLRIEDSAFLETMMSDDGLAAMKAYIAQPYEKRRAWLERPVAPEYKGH